MTLVKKLLSSIIIISSAALFANPWNDGIEIGTSVAHSYGSRSLFINPAAIAYENELIADLEEQAKLADKFNQKLGITGNTIKGLNKIPVLGGLIKSEEVLARIQKKTAEEGSTRFDIFKEGVKGVGSSIASSLTDPVVGFSALTSIS